MILRCWHFGFYNGQIKKFLKIFYLMPEFVSSLSHFVCYTMFITYTKEDFNYVDTKGIKG